MGRVGRGAASRARVTSKDEVGSRKVWVHIKCLRGTLEIPTIKIVCFCQ